MDMQKTLKAPFSLSGKGLHTGLDIVITFQHLLVRDVSSVE